MKVCFLFCLYVQIRQQIGCLHNKQPELCGRSNYTHRCCPRISRTTAFLDSGTTTTTTATAEQRCKAPTTTAALHTDQLK